MEILRGIAVAPGVAMGEAVILGTEDYRIPYRAVSPSDCGEELKRLDEAFRASLAELQTQSQWLEENLGRDAADVFTWHTGVLKDKQLRSSIESLIQERNYSAAYATSTVMRNYQRRFLQMDNPVLVERIRDVQDIERRLLRNILGEACEDLAHLTQASIVVAHDLTPTQTIQLAGTKVIGVALDSGAATSHTAILLRSWGKPAVIGVTDVSTRVSGGDTVIIDAVNQLVITNPSKETQAQYESQQATFTRHTDALERLKALDSVTRDGTRVRLWSNIEFPHEAAVGMANGADGVGLYRTEFLFLRSETTPSEDEQYESYRQAIIGACGKPVTIRTFDLGADKHTQDARLEPERNPMLGLRSIRYSLQNLEMFKTQLRAILRASVHGPVRLMFPLIVSLMEFRQAKMTLHDAMEDLEEAGIEFRRDIPVGMMLETPAGVVQIEAFCKEVGFISIGTNDLIQYLLAVDRGNERVSRFYDASHPAVLHALRDVVKACTRHKTPVSLCGEMAGDALYTLFLLGIGLRDFSMAPGNLTEIKQVIRAATTGLAQRVAKRALSFETERQVSNYLREETKKLLPEDPLW